jgi:hypothetical protein
MRDDTGDPVTSLDIDAPQEAQPALLLTRPFSKLHFNQSGIFPIRSPKFGAWINTPDMMRSSQSRCGDISPSINDLNNTSSQGWLSLPLLILPAAMFRRGSLVQLDIFGEEHLY